MKKTLLTLVFFSTLFLTGCSRSSYTLEKEVNKIAAQAIRLSKPEKCNSLPLKDERPAPEDDHFRETIVTYAHDDCLEKYVKEKKDTQVCAMMSELINRNYCYLLNTKNTNDIEWCNKIVSGDDKNWVQHHIKIKNECISYIAEVYSDPNICERLDGADAAHWKASIDCRAIAARDIQECYNFDKQGFVPPQFTYSPRTNCITEVVKRTHNEKDCTKINYPGYFSEDAVSDRNMCLVFAGCNKPEKRKEICKLMNQESRWCQLKDSQQDSEDWVCAPVPKRVK